MKDKWESASAVESPHTMFNNNSSHDCCFYWWWKTKEWFDPLSPP